MAGADIPEAIAGLLLLFFLPGYTLTKATFPEWRLRGREALLRFLETITLAFVLSVVLTVLAGSALLAANPGGFQAYWTDPVLEALLAAIALVGFGVGWFRGAYRREPPSAPVRETGQGEEGAWELSRELDELRREERRIAHALRIGAQSASEEARLREELAHLRARRDELREQREAEYAA
ncbi:MAG: DUF1616 domain-containing protein [Thermoplasmata archaeon]